MNPTDMIALVQTGFSGATFAVLLLVLYRITQLETDLKELGHDHARYRRKVDRMEVIVTQKEANHA